ncbi:hypothetical protein UlMin_011585 [Ulmus minor]
MCSSDTTAIIWFYECMVRNSDINFIGKQEVCLQMYSCGIKKLFRAKYLPLKNDSNQNRFGLGQCTRDIDRAACKICLMQLAEDIVKCCLGRRGWSILAPSCDLRYEYYRFYENPPQSLPAAPQPLPGDKGKGKQNTTTIIIIILSSLAALAAFLENNSLQILLAGSESFTDRNMHDKDHDNGGEIHFFNLSTIQAATNHFSDANMLGEGGFGPVYKGKLIDGKGIVVKRLYVRSKQGLEEFKTEVILIARLQHKNLVKLFRKVMDWNTGANIVNGIARGLLYLHEDSRLKIIHSDLKASNVLLDDEMNPKISDFGTARIFGLNQIEANTTRVVGTSNGYMATEYVMEGLFSIKSDVYSFGALMLEIITGKENSGGEEIIDPNLVDASPKNEALRWIHIALLCVQEDPRDRPTISSAVLMLASKTIHLPKPSKPPFSERSFLKPEQLLDSEQVTGSLTSDQASTTVSCKFIDWSDNSSI